MEFNGRNYLIVIDNYSGHFEFELRDTTSTTVIIQMKLFFVYGNRVVLESDSGPQRRYVKFKKFATNW